MKSVKHKVKDQVYNQVWIKIANQNICKFTLEMWDQLVEQNHNLIFDHIWEKVWDQMLDEMRQR